MNVTQEIYIEFTRQQYDELRERATAEGLQLDELIVRAIRNLLKEESI